MKDKLAYPLPDYLAKRLNETLEKKDQSLDVGGLMRRELFAAMVMQGYIANKSRPTHFHPTDDAKWCVKLADALIKELDR